MCGASSDGNRDISCSRVESKQRGVALAKSPNLLILNVTREERRAHVHMS